jgi:hypothetical protein
VSFSVITLCVASQRVFIVVSVYFVIDSVRKRLDTPSYYEVEVTSSGITFIPSSVKVGQLVQMLKREYARHHGDPTSLLILP